METNYFFQKNPSPPPEYQMARPLPTIIFGKKYCRGSQRAQQEIQEQSSNTEEQELRAIPNYTRVLHEYYKIKHLSNLMIY